MKAKEKIHLTEEKETLFITLYAKALDNRSKHSILHDQTAEDILNIVDYDFTKHTRFVNKNVLVIRAKQLDEWAKKFMQSYPDAVVVYPGCGLDTRVTRLNPPLHVSWFDIDYPEVTALRRRFYSNKDGYTMIESSVTNPDWMAQIPPNRPALIIADGLLEYLAPDEVKTLLNRLTAHFQQGEIIFNVMSSFAIAAGKAKMKETTGAVHKWAVDDAREVDKLDLKLKRLEDISLIKSPYMRMLPFRFRLFFGFASLIPRYQNMVRLMRYRF